MWCALIRSLTDDYTCRDPATPGEIAACERVLGSPLPAELAELLLEANGIDDEYGGGVVWSTERIAEENRSFRTNEDFPGLYMPFDSLLFFGDAGNGDLFAFVSLDGLDNVFAWDHETDSRIHIARGVRRYLASRARTEPYDASTAAWLAYRHSCPDIADGEPVT